MTARNIDVGTPRTRFARGWHCLGLADSFRDGQPHAIEAFGTKLVLWAAQDGTINVLDGYCRHMGGDLSQGTVKGDSIACPFHDWRWDGDGRCRNVPYAKRVPMRARTRAWPTCEQNKQLFVWNDPEGNAPIPEQAIPEIPGIHGDEWSPWTWDQLRIDGSSTREVIDNVVDMAHFFYIHHAFPLEFRNVFSGHIASQYMESKQRPDWATNPEQAENAMLRSEAAYYGPSYMIDYLYPSFNGVQLECVLINCHYPIGHDSFMLQWGLTTKALPGMTEEQRDKMGRKLGKNFGDGFLEDVAMWQTKTRIDNPLLSEEDGPFYQLRRWYEQFFVDLADISEDMTDRFEFEVDTTKANEVWEQEVAENLASQDAPETADA